MALPFGAHVPFSTHNPSPLSFGFGLGVPQHHLPPPPPPPIQSTSQQATNSSSINQRTQLSESTQRTSEKRRRQVDDEDDAAMETGRSPSPGDRSIRKIVTKKLRQTPLSKVVSDVKDPAEDDVDIGSLLASLPPSSLLPLLTSLVDKKPELKPIVLSLIPRPTLETAISAINEGAKRLREAYPYSLPSPASSSSTSSGFAFGAGGQASSPRMNESYIRTRLRQPVRDFTKLVLSYVSYFSSTPPVTSNTKPGEESSGSNPARGDSPPKLPVVSLHPADTFTFLHNLTLHLLRLPSLTLAEFARPSENILYPRLQAEWTAWLQKIDDDVNRFGGMYQGGVVRVWERGLDELVNAEEAAMQLQKEPGMLIAPGSGYVGMKVMRTNWVKRVGWLIGKTADSVGMEM